MVDGAGRSVPLRALELATSGPDALGPPPQPEDLAARPAGERHEVLEELRVDLYAIAAMLADGTLRQARAERSSYPPYGLVRSMHSESRLVLASPDPVEEGAIATFDALGKACIDTVVFYLHRQFKDLRASDRVWILQRLEDLLALFRIDAGPATRSRMRDGLSFVYGGLHFGTSVCIQLTEVMSRMLDEWASEMSDTEKIDLITRSSRPAYRLAALNIDHVVAAYQSLQAPASSGRAGWMDRERFTLHQSKDGKWRIDLRHEDTLDGQPTGRRFDDIPTTYQTHGCPARSSPTGGHSAIAIVWSWSVELTRDTGLLGRVLS